MELVGKEIQKYKKHIREMFGYEGEIYVDVEGDYDNPRYNPKWYGSKKKMKRERLLEYIDELEEANKYLEKKLHCINHDTLEARESYYACQEKWEKKWEELTDFERKLFWSGYLQYADELNGYYFECVGE